MLVNWAFLHLNLRGEKLKNVKQPFRNALFDCIIVIIILIIAIIRKLTLFARHIPLMVTHQRVLMEPSAFCDGKDHLDDDCLDDDDDGGGDDDDV